MKPFTCEKHPATEWAEQQDFSASEVDCTVTVVLKILDGKCKMLAGEKAAIMHIYDVARNARGVLFNAEIHKIIDSARNKPEASVMGRVHELRVYAESTIPKSVMKKYKAMLHHGLFS